MTENEKNIIIDLRNKGLGYKSISKETGISLGTIKSFLIRLKNKGEKNSQNCKNCGSKLVQTRGHRQKVFCSDKCRIQWWSKNQNLINKEQMIKCTCPICNKVFYCYPAKNKKYCSWDCYITSKKAGKNHE